MSELKDLEFLATKSKELMDKQINSYRQQQATASSIVAIVALFIPLFLSNLDEAYQWIKIIAVGSVALFVTAICLLLFHVFRSRPLSQALSFDKLSELINSNNYEEILLYEISANKASFQDNKTILISRNKFYNVAVLLTISAIIISVILLLSNKFLKRDKRKDPVQVEIVKSVSIIDSIKLDTTVKMIMMSDSSTTKCLKKLCCRHNRVTRIR